MKTMLDRPLTTIDAIFLKAISSCQCFCLCVLVYYLLPSIYRISRALDGSRNPLEPNDNICDQNGGDHESRNTKDEVRKYEKSELLNPRRRGTELLFWLRLRFMGSLVEHQLSRLTIPSEDSTDAKVTQGISAEEIAAVKFVNRPLLLCERHDGFFCPCAIYSALSLLVYIQIYYDASHSYGVSGETSSH